MMRPQRDDSASSRTGARAMGLVLLLFIAVGAPPALAQGAGRWVNVGHGVDRWLRGEYGGPVGAADLAPGCVGWVSADPNFVLDVDAERWVRIYVEGDHGSDTTLLLRGPDGPICNNDASRHTRNPEIITRLEEGRYDLFIGAADPGARGQFEMHVAEVTEEELPELQPDGRLRLQGVSGGPIDASEHGESCIGNIAVQPNHTIRLAEPMWVVVQAVSSSDLTLVVVGEEATLCNDDGPQTLDPQVAAWFPAGLLRIYVGSHNPSVNAFYTLIVEPGHSG